MKKPESKKPESNNKFIVSIVFIYILIQSIPLCFYGIATSRMWMTIVGVVLTGASFIVLSYGSGELFKIFFNTILGKNNKDNNDNEE